MKRETAEELCDGLAVFDELENAEEVSSVAPEVSSVAPEVSSVAPEVSSVAPALEVSSVAPSPAEIILALQQELAEERSKYSALVVEYVALQNEVSVMREELAASFREEGEESFPHEEMEADVDLHEAIVFTPSEELMFEEF